MIGDIFPYLEEFREIWGGDLTEHVAFRKSLSQLAVFHSRGSDDAYHIRKKRQSHPKLLIVHVQERNRHTLLVRTKYSGSFARSALEDYQLSKLNIL